MLASRGVAEKQPVSLRTKRGRRAPARLVGTNGGTYGHETRDKFARVLARFSHCHFGLQLAGFATRGHSGLPTLACELRRPSASLRATLKPRLQSSTT